MKRKRRKLGLGVMISVGRWGGVYFYKSDETIRIALGFVAVTVFFQDGDDVLDLARIGAECLIESADG